MLFEVIDALSEHHRGSDIAGLKGVVEWFVGLENRDGVDGGLLLKQRILVEQDGRLPLNKVFPHLVKHF